MVDINKHPLIRQAYDLCHAIEACGCSSEITTAAIQASALMSAIEKYIDRINAYDTTDGHSDSNQRHQKISH